MWPPAVNPDPTTFLVALYAWVYFGFAALFAFVGNLNPAVASHVSVVLHFLLGNVLVLLLCLSSFSVLFGNSNPGAASSGCCLLLAAIFAWESLVLLHFLLLLEL